MELDDVSSLSGWILCAASPQLTLLAREKNVRGRYFANLEIKCNPETIVIQQLRGLVKCPFPRALDTYNFQIKPVHLLVSHRQCKVKR